MTTAQREDWKALAVRVARGEFPTQHLRTPRADGMTARVELASGETVVLKLWRRPGMPSLARRALRSGPAVREWTARRRLAQIGVAGPKVLHVSSLRGCGTPYTEAIFLEDLGDCEQGGRYLKRLLNAGEEKAAAVFEQSLVDTTMAMVRGKILDPDHRVSNFLVKPCGSAVRLDLELARTVLHPSLHPWIYGHMLGTLVGSYCFIVQPDVPRAMRFALLLADRLQPSAPTLKVAKGAIARMLAAQRASRGIDTHLNLRW